ncbi:DNA adenine methylase [Treponema pedis]|uniref:DNA adenine methylase n=1 Tax=Treponema pedis TaxID=409322 RepID=UPI000570D742|nr:Dam family site-specific DNA-(adenine-N6)-methyltransferase [Treponema pedis]
MKQIIASPMNYIGGKYKILPQILPLFPENIGTFVDLFCGGCNVGINVSAKKVIFNDNLSYLIDLYKKFESLSENDVINHIENRIKQFNLSLTNKDGYLELRKFYNQEKNPLDLFVLTAYSFNHQIRFNNSHGFNNPFGKDRSCFNEHMKTNLLNFLKELNSKNTEFTSFNFDEFDFSKLCEDDFVYCDPPYLITTGTYNDGKRGFTGWNEEQEKKLLQILDELNKKNVYFALSNVLEHKGKENLILKNWIEGKKYFVSYLVKNYSNSNYHTIDRNKNSTVEVLITNYNPQTLAQEKFALKLA